MSSGDYLGREDEEIYIKPKFKNKFKCVLIHQSALEQIKSQIERLRQENEQLRNNNINSEMNLKIMTDLVEQLKQELQEAKDMLAKCSPYIIKFISNDGISIFVECEFCGADGYNCIDTHKPDCKYINMIGGVE